MLSITPECCPKAYLKFFLIKFFCCKEYSPKGYEKKIGLYPKFVLKISIDLLISSLKSENEKFIRYS